MPKWIIKSVHNDNCWNNGVGWVYPAGATKYTDEERYGFILPAGGSWVELEQKEKPVCKECGSDDIKADAFAVWDVDAQEWRISDTFDKGAICENCGGECSFEWVPA